MTTWNPLIFTDEYLRVRAVPTCHTSTYVFLHGKGQQGGDWQFIVEPLRQLGHSNHIAFIFPYLDYSEATTNTISKNEALIQKIVNQEIVNGCDPARITVGGFNEGFDVALLATLADDKHKIASIQGITDRVKLADSIKALTKPANASTPVFVVDRSGAGDSAGEKLLKALGQPIGAYVDGSKHVASSLQPVSTEDIEALDSFIHKTLPVEIALKN